MFRVYQTGDFYIFFYERLGFALSDIEYIQPLLHKASPNVLLRLMHYPAEIYHVDVRAINVAREVNHELLVSYWKIGEIIDRDEQNDSIRAEYVNRL